MKFFSILRPQASASNLPFVPLSFFFCKLPAAILSFVLLASTAIAAETKEPRGERVGWARLKTESPHWKRHATGDPSLMLFLRQNTNLNIDPNWHVADVGNLQAMSHYPLLFSQGIHMVGEPTHQANLGEYIRRGGFLLIDACINAGITPNPSLFLEQQKKALKGILPEGQVLPLPSTHPLYRSYFRIPEGTPPHTYFNNVFSEEWHKHGLYGFYIDSRLAGVISLSGLQCGWDHMIAPPGHNVACMRMLVNIYVHAILQGD